jgi:ABC-2 type transport system permease protein
MGGYSAMDETILDIFEAMPPALASLYGANDGTVVGLALGAMFAMIIPAVLLTYAISGGVGAAVGEENKGSMDLLLANPISRSGVSVPKWAVVVIGVVVIGLVTWLSSWLGATWWGDGPGELDILAASVMAVALALMFGGLAMAIAGWTGRSGIGAGVAAGVAGVSWLVTSILSVEESLATLSKLTPWYLYSGPEPVLNGIGWWQLIVMAGSGLLLAWIGVVGLDRRDLKG